MQRLSSFVVPFAVALSVLAGFHYYLWARLVRDPGWPAPWARIFTCLIVGFGAALPVALLTARALPLRLARWVSLPPYIWLGTAFLLGVFLSAADVAGWVARAFAAVLGRARGFDPERREILARAVAGGSGAATAALAAAGIRSALGEVALVEVPVRLERLPRTLSGLTIAQLSDIHVGPTIGRRFIEQIVERTNAVKPDVIAITGDLVDGSVARLFEHVAPLSKLHARFGVYFVTGNHEYYSGADAWLAALHKLGIRTLHNERVSIGDGGGTIDLAGVDDASAHRFGHGHGADYDRAFAGRDPDRELVLLAHQPRQILPAVTRQRIGLQLSGHTHGGQIWPFGHLVRLVEPYVAGLHRHEQHNQIYVSRGTGYWGPPLRLGAPAEITKLVLVPC